MPTQFGDVFILRTDKSLSTHAVGPVSKDGQQDFQRHTNLKYLSGRPAALAEAKALAVPGRRTFIRNLDTDEWAEISH